MMIHIFYMIAGKTGETYIVLNQQSAIYMGDLVGKPA